MIKGLCTESGDKSAKFLFENSLPIAGRYYSFEDQTVGTNKQNSLFHSLITCLWEFMFETNTFIIEDNGVIYNLSSDCVKSLKKLLKARYGKGFETYKYVNDNNGISNADNLVDIPLHILDDFTLGNKDRINGIIYSWSGYTLPQRHKLIAKVFVFIDLFGVESYKYEDIKNGLIQIEEERKAENKRLKNDKINV